RRFGIWSGQSRLPFASRAVGGTIPPDAGSCRRRPVRARGGGMGTGKPETVDDDIAGIAPEKRAILEKIRATIREAAPGAKEGWGGVVAIGGGDACGGGTPDGGAGTSPGDRPTRGVRAPGAGGLGRDGAPPGPGAAPGAGRLGAGVRHAEAGRRG